MKTISIFFLVVISLTSFFCCAQLPEETKWPYFKNYTDAQKDLIQSYWKEYFEKDVSKDLDPSVKMSPICLDTYGGVYPDFDLLKDVKLTPFSNKSERKKYQYKFSLYHLFESDNNARNQFLENVKQLRPEIHDSVSGFFHTCFERRSRYSKQKMEIFYDRWNKFFNQVKYESLKQQLSRENKKSIFLFTHGFNVPYSLAVVQSQQYYHFLKDTLGIDMDTVLYVPVFWTSGVEKDCNLTEKDFTIENHIWPLNGGFRSKRQFKYYSNHCYSASLTFRELINHLEDKTSIYFFAHSLGATIATSTFINTYSKYVSDEKSLSNFISKNWKIMDAATFKKSIYQFKTSFGVYQVLSGFKTIPLPTNKNIRIFLSAPAIPGCNTFTDLFDPRYTNQSYNLPIRFFTTFNIEDPMLNKSMIPLINRLGLSNATKFGSTSLGSDFNNEIDKVHDLFAVKQKEADAKKGHFPSFRAEAVQLDDHDVFLYMKQLRYQSLTQEFFNDTAKNSYKNRLKNETLFQFELTRLDNSFGMFGPNDPRFRSLAAIIKNLLDTDFNKDALPMAKMLYEIEKAHRQQINESLRSETKQYIYSIDHSYHLALLERSLKDMPFKKDQQNVNTYDIQKMLVEATAKHRSLIDKKNQSFYIYPTNEKRIIKCFQLRTGNDLLAPFSINYDRDYTGSLNAEFATDYLNPSRKRPIKSYQTFGYGFDVFTPQFRDTLKFTNSTDYDSLDRPHASFQYLQWSKKGLSRTNKIRWSITVKLGIIGSKIGYSFQNVVHRDVSSSLSPKGWDAQIANGGRLGTSLEVKHEFLFKLNEVEEHENYFYNLYFVPSTEIKYGSYMTNASIGLSLTNKKFEANNHYFINKRSNLGYFNFWDHMMYRLNITGTFVKHNTMLEGFGYWRTTEHERSDFDDLTHKSAYVLQDHLVRRFIYYANLTLSYTRRNVTFFYNYFIFSPETKLGRLDAIDPKRTPIDVGKRLHFFTEIGLNFCIK